MSQQIPCCLPKFGSASEQPKRPMSLRIRPNPSANAQLLSVWREGTLNPVLQATWALVLRCYTESGDICFGYQHIAADGHSAERRVSPNVTNLTTVRLTIEDGDSVRALVEQASDHGATDMSVNQEGMNAMADGYLLYNTILLIRSYDGQTQDARAAPLPATLASTLPEEVCTPNMFL